MAIGDDFQVYPYSKTIRHINGTTVYTAVEFYSWLMDLFDEPGYMSYQTPIKFNTPTSFTMLNGWFLDNGDGSNLLQFLSGGSIDTSGYSTISDPIYVLDLDGTTDFVASDKDKTITDDGGDVGPLLAYLNDYPTAGSARIWIRDTNSNGQIADNSAIATSGGTGSGDANGASFSGDEIYANLYTIASFPGSPNPQVYIYQAHPVSGTQTRIAEWSAYSNWDRGSIDVLLPVKIGGSLIDSGNVYVRVRQTGDTFTFVNADLSSGARTPVAVETTADTVNITKGEHYLLYDNEQNGGFSAGDVIQDVATDSGTPPSWYAEVVDVDDWGTEGVLTLRGLRGQIADNDAIYVGTTQRGTANGTPGDTYTTYTAESSPLTVGNVITGGSSGAKRILVGLQDDGTTGKLVLKVDNDQDNVAGSSRNPYYRDFSAGETLTDEGSGSVTHQAAASTTLVSGYTDITVMHINGTVTVSNVSGTFQFGERINWNGGSSHANFVKLDGSTMYLANVDPTDEPDAADSFTGEVSGATADCDSGLTDANTATFAFPLQTAVPYSVAIEAGSLYEAGRDLDDVYAFLQYNCRDGAGSTESVEGSPMGSNFYTSDGSSITLEAKERYTKAVGSYTATKPAPFGTLAGGVFFGAQGVWVDGMAAADANNVRLTAHNGNSQTPYTSVAITISNTRAEDVILVALNDGSGLPDKAQYTSHASSNTQGGSTFDKDSGSFPNDTPTSGTFYVVDTSANEEHRYRYTSYSGGQLTLPTKRTGTATSGSSGQTLVDSSATFQTWGIQRGDIIRNTTDAGWGYVVSVDSETQLTTTHLTTSGRDWASGDGYEINALVVTYDDNDTFYIPYLDTIEDTGTDGSPGSETQTLTYVTDRSVVVRVRNVGGATPIVPFITTSTITDAGMTVSVIRTEDTVYT